MGLEYFFKNFLINRCKGRDFGGKKYFSKFSYLPPPLKVNWIPLLTPFLLCTILHNALRMKMRLNQDVGGDAKSAPVAYARVYLESILVSLPL